MRPGPVIAEVVVTAVRPMSPSFVRVEFAGTGLGDTGLAGTGPAGTGPAGTGLADFGVDGPMLDQRIKLVIPTGSDRLPMLSGADGSWYQRWRELPSGERGAMRTYSVRDVLGEGADTRLVVDFVLHLTPGRCGPASTWAARARPGDRLVVIGPRRGTDWGGIEFAPGGATELLLVGDETAVPAISRILADLGDDVRGAAFLEVPHVADVLTVDPPSGVTVRWLPRNGRGHGELLVETVTAHLGGDPGRPGDDAIGPADADVWETPGYSSSGEEVRPGRRPVAPQGDSGLYAWIAGESRMVTRLRRHLVRGLGMDRGQVAFMGYWRDGVAAAE